MTEQLRLKVGEWYEHHGERVRLVRTPNLTEVQVRDERGDLRTVPLFALGPVKQEASNVNAARTSRPLDSRAHAQALAGAEERMAVLESLVALPGGRASERVAEAAKRCEVHPSTIYRWLAAHDRSGSMEGLMRKPRQDQGKSRLPPAVEELMDRVIETKYLVPERPSLSSVYVLLRGEIERANRTHAAGEPELPTPSYETFRRRIGAVEQRKRVSRRYGHRAAEALDPILGHYPGATYPLAVVQIDHTPIDLELVDSIYRRPIGRPWLTLVMDVFSRAVLGFYISFDAPNAFSAGMALTHAILPKEIWLAGHQQVISGLVKNLRDELVGGDPDLQLSWPCWGKPVLVKMDNAREFRGKTLERALRWHGIDREFRPVKKPRYGGHVERLLGTFAREIQTLPGTTFSNPRARGDYDSEGRAALTLEAFETWLTAYILGIYHCRTHESLGKTPLQMWEDGLLIGTDDHPPTGVPERLGGDAANRLKMDFLPFFEGTVQRAGIRHDGLTYRSDVLRRHVGARHPDYPSRARVFQVSYDPRDISGVYFLDPDINRYFEVRCVQANFPSMSVWELKATRRFAKSQNIRLDNEIAIMNAYRLMQRLVDSEKAETKSIRAGAEKKRQRAKVETPAGVERLRAPSLRRSALNPFQHVGEIKPFDEIE